MALSAALAAVSTIGGALLSSSATKKAANKAAGVAADTAANNNALTQWMYNQNSAALNPYQQRGNRAGEAYNALLGLGTPTNNRGMEQVGTFGGQSAYGSPTSPAFPQFGGQSIIGGDGFSGLGIDNPRSMMMGNYDLNGNPVGGDTGGIGVPSAMSGMAAPTGAPAAPGTTPNALSPYQQAFSDYQNSTGYQFRLGEGQKAIGAGFAARGLNNSGAAVKSALTFNQNTASGEFNNYLAQLMGQQNVGLGAASAQAGVGQNLVANMTANNNSAGTAAANAALAGGQANANLYGSIAGGIGNLFGSSFKFG